MKNTKKNYKLQYWDRPDFVPNKVMSLPGEEWRDIKGCWRYKVSNLGRIMRREYEYHTPRFNAFAGKEIILGNFYQEMIIQQFASKDGKYKTVTLKKDDKTATTFLVHRIVAEAFLPNPNKLPQVHHIDGNGYNNRADNLMWVTTQENMREPIRRKRLSDQLKNRKLSEEHKSRISKSRRENPTYRKSVLFGNIRFETTTQAAQFFECSSTTIKNWIVGKTQMPQKYKDIGLCYDVQNQSPNKVDHLS